MIRKLACVALVVVGLGTFAWSQEGQQVRANIVATTCTNQFIRSIVAATGAGTCATVSLTADVTGTLPVANGGTGNTGGTWPVTAPAAGCNAGGTITATTSLSTMPAISKLTVIELSFTITAISACLGGVTYTLPFTAQNNCVFAARNDATGAPLTARAVGTQLIVQASGGTAPGVLNDTIFIGGPCQTQ